MFIDKINHYYSRILQETAFRTGGSFGKPTSIIVLLTNRCNSKCVHCHSWKVPHKNKELSTDEWINGLNTLRGWLGPVFISITGGETLLRSDAIDIVEHASKISFRTEFLTNGYLLDDNKAERLLLAGVNRVKISLDGSRPEIHDKVRGRSGFFSRARGALQNLSKKRRNLSKDVVIWGKTTIMSHNVDDLANIVLLAKELEIDGIEFQALEPVYYSKQLGDTRWYIDNPLWINDISRVSESIGQLKALKTQGFPIINSVENLELIEKYFGAPTKLAHKVHAHDYHNPRTTCRGWVAGLQIMPDGNMKNCHWMTPFGNIRNGKPREEWKSRPKCWETHCKFLA